MTWLELVCRVHPVFATMTDVAASAIASPAGGLTRRSGAVSAASSRLGESRLRRTASDPGVVFPATAIPTTTNTTTNDANKDAVAAMHVPAPLETPHAEETSLRAPTPPAFPVPPATPRTRLLASSASAGSGTTPTSMSLLADASWTDRLTFRLETDARGFLEAVLHSDLLHRFYSAEAKYEQVSSSEWRETPTEDDGFGLSESSPERTVAFCVSTGVPLAPNRTRVEERHRYFCFGPGDAPTEETLVFQATRKFLDVPYSDSFALRERWVVRSVPAAATTAVEVLVMTRVVFSRPMFRVVSSAIETGLVRRQRKERELLRDFLATKRMECKGRLASLGLGPGVATSSPTSVLASTGTGVGSATTSATPTTPTSRSKDDDDAGVIHVPRVYVLAALVYLAVLTLALLLTIILTLHTTQHLAHDVSRLAVATAVMESSSSSCPLPVSS